MLAGATDVYVATQPMRGWRAVERAMALRTLVADLDIYRVPDLQGGTPESVTALVLEFISSSGWPEPSLVTDTGRGLAVWWCFDDVPTRALPRWQAVEDLIVEALAPFGADPAATDAARVLRLVGTVNGKNGRTVNALHTGPRCTFEAMARAVLPHTREQLRELRDQAAKRRAARKRSRQADQVSPGRGAACRLTAATWATTLQEDLRRLQEHRFGTASVARGCRDLWLFCNAVAACWRGGPDSAASTVREAAADVGWSPGRALKKMGSALRRAYRAARGAKATYAGRQVDPRYTPRAATMMGWLGVTTHEARCADLRLLIPREVYLERERARSSGRRAARGCMSRDEYRTLAEARAAEAARMRRSGHCWADVARELGLPSGDAARKLAGRAAEAQPDAVRGVDRSDRVTSGVAPQEAPLPGPGHHPFACTASSEDLVPFPPSVCRRPSELHLLQSETGTRETGGGAAQSSGSPLQPFQACSTTTSACVDQADTTIRSGHASRPGGTPARRWSMPPQTPTLGRRTLPEVCEREHAYRGHANDNVPDTREGSIAETAGRARRGSAESVELPGPVRGTQPGDRRWSAPGRRACHPGGVKALFGAACVTPGDLRTVLCHSS